eukprot:TRINITY_DN6009_c0_g1_i2.p1 TRINITY_DN6009_c0_g1~~TRINITY_DN6009_c0_g1_i2.p1  ORF type:complete len:194 (-),score=73.34 TRINITY_DN6009_c0_g1_i2:470-1051(-)
MEDDESNKNKRKREEVDLNKLTVNLLKDILKKKSLKVNGKKSELIERIKASISVNEIEDLVEEVLEDDADSESASEYSEDFNEKKNFEKDDYSDSLLEDNFSEELDELERIDPEKLKKLSFTELKDLAKKKGITSGRKKEEIIDLIVKHDDEKEEMLKLRLKDVSNDLIAKIPEVIFKNFILVNCDLVKSPHT